MTDVQIVVPSGMFGPSADDDFLDTALRVIGVAFAQPGEWASKYGTNYENDVFVMRTQYWGDCTCGAMECGPDEPERDCDPTCPMVLPNFRHKASGFEVEWYKYIGRSMMVRGTPPVDLLQQIFASHPTGMSIEQAFEEFARDADEQSQALQKMFSTLGVKAGDGA